MNKTYTESFQVRATDCDFERRMRLDPLFIAMQEGGVSACAKIVARIYGSGPDRAKSLAYRLYTLAEQKGWTQEAYAYNALVVAWPEIQSKTLEMKNVHMVQGTL